MDNSKRTDTELPDVLTILTSLGIELPQRINQSNIEIRCPFCDDKKHHLRFSLENEKYYCPRCNASGNILTFYAQMRNISNKEAHKELLSQEFGAATASIPRREFEQVKTAPLVLNGMLSIWPCSTFFLLRRTIDRIYWIADSPKNRLSSMVLNPCL